MKQIGPDFKRKIDILVCNAGVLKDYGELEDGVHDSCAIETVLMTNISNVFFTTPSFLAHLAEVNCTRQHQ